MYIVTIATVSRKNTAGTLRSHTAYVGEDYDDALDAAMEEFNYYANMGFKVLDGDGDNYATLQGGFSKSELVTIRVERSDLRYWI